MFADQCRPALEELMRGAWIAPLLLGFALAGCGGSTPAPAESSTAALEGDAALIASAQVISDQLGGCTKPDGAAVESKVVGLESGPIVLLACSQDKFTYTHRLFAIRAGQKPELISLPDYDDRGMFATDQASLAELDAGTGVLTTFRKAAEHGRCGSEARYQWNGERFDLQELHWQD
ncbi:MAG TPA: hypothetical protein VFV87_05520, partial [Pirellulaceae bacterium]|nr:hypothetical protein [Pirellulaceae bacterium]